MTHLGFGALRQNSEKKVDIGFSGQLVDACVAKQAGSDKKLATQGTEMVTGRCVEQTCRQKVLHEFFIKRVMIHNVVLVHI